MKKKMLCILLMTVFMMHNTVVGGGASIGLPEEGAVIATVVVTTATPNQPIIPIIMSADKSSVIAGVPTDITFDVWEGCPDGMICTMDIRPIPNVYIQLSGAAVESSYTNNDGRAIITINANYAGTITATASKSGYRDTTITIVVEQQYYPLSITADTNSVYVREAKSVIFTVTSNGQPVPGANIRLDGVAVGSIDNTNSYGQASAIINASGEGTITITASKSGYTNGVTTITALNKNIPPSLILSADTSLVYVGKPKAIKFKVTTKNTCNPDAGQVCATPYMSSDLAVSGANVRLEGAAIANDVTAENGEMIITVNARYEGTIVVTTSKSGYIDDSITIQAKSSDPVPNTGYAYISSNVNGINIYIDGTYKGAVAYQEQARFELPVGIHNLKATKEHFKDFEREFAIRPNDVTYIHITMIYVPPQNNDTYVPKEKFRAPPTVVVRPLNDIIDKSQDGIIEIYMDNPSLNDITLNMDMRITIPAGIHIYGQGLGETGSAGVVYSKFDVLPGQSKTIYANIKADRAGEFNIHLVGSYWPGDNKDAYKPISLTHPFKVYEQSTPVPNTPYQTIPAQKHDPINIEYLIVSQWWWLMLVMILVILLVIVLGKK